MQRRHFTLDEATGLVPWLEARFQQTDRNAETLERRQKRVDELLRRRQGNGHGSIGQELSRAEDALKEIQSEIGAVLQEIIERGILVRDIKSGLVDFPTLMDGAEVFLCWIRGEEAIRYWHGTNEGFASRKPL